MYLTTSGVIPFAGNLRAIGIYLVKDVSNNIPSLRYVYQVVSESNETPTFMNFFSFNQERITAQNEQREKNSSSKLATKWNGAMLKISRVFRDV
jgi:hypothetical protein